MFNIAQSSPSNQKMQLPFQHQTNFNMHQPQFYQFQQNIPVIKPLPKWSVLNQENNPNIISNPPTTASITSSSACVTTLLTDVTDDHFNRHIENLNRNEEEDNFSLIIEEQEELNEVKLTKLISSLKNNKKQQDLSTKKTNDQDEDDDDLTNNDDEPKTYQDEEEVDLVPTTSNPVLLTKNTTKTDINISLTTSLTHQNKQHTFQSIKQQTTQISENKTIPSVMPTPLAYSRSSSLTSLNSFDVKSIHSSVASEYSHLPAKFKQDFENSQLDILDDDQEYVDEEQDLDRIMPDSPAAPADSSFLKAQRIRHKQQEVQYRQTAAAAGAALPVSQTNSNILVKTSTFTSTSKSWQTSVQQPQLSSSLTNSDLNSFMSRLALKQKPDMDSEHSFLNQQQMCSYPSNTPPVKLLPTPKFANQNPNQQMIPLPIQAQPVMSVTYAFMKNSQSFNPPNPAPPKFLMSSNHHQKQLQFNQQQFQPIIKSPQQKPISQQNYSSPLNEDTPCVYSIETRTNLNKLNGLNTNNASVQSSCQTSPQESICSRMSDASIPSLIRQDIGLSSQKFRSVINQGLMPNPVNTNPVLKSLFQKFQSTHQAGNECLSSSSSSSSSSCASVVNKHNYQQNKNQIQFDIQNAGLDEQNESVNNLNITTKPMNTPAGLASISGASIIDISTDNDQENEDEDQVGNYNDQNASVKENCLYLDFDLENFIKENFQPAKSINTSYDESDFHSNKNSKSFKRASLQSLDLSNLNHATSSQSINNKTVKAQQPRRFNANTSIDHSVADRQSSNSSKQLRPFKKRLSEDNSSNLKLVSQIKPKTNGPEAQSSRLNRNNSHSINSHTTSVCSSIPASTSSMSISSISSQSKPVANKTTGPVVNMTKTAQLRASKLTSVNSNTKKTSVFAKPVNPSASLPKQVNKLVKPRESMIKQASSGGISNDKLNQTVNTENVFHSDYQQLNQPSNSYHQHLQHLTQANVRRKSFSFGSSIAGVAANKKEPVKKELVAKQPVVKETGKVSTVQQKPVKSEAKVVGSSSNLSNKATVSSNLKTSSKVSTNLNCTKLL